MSQAKGRQRAALYNYPDRPSAEVIRLPVRLVGESLSTFRARLTLWRQQRGWKAKAVAEGPRQKLAAAQLAFQFGGRA